MSDKFGPFDVRLGILQRSTEFVDLIVRQRPGTTAFNLYMSSNLTDAYGTMTGSGFGGSGGTLVLSATVKSTVLSPTMIKRNWKIEESRKGHTSFQVDSEDYGFPDEQMFYVRVQEQRAGNFLVSPGPSNTGYPIRGPILIVPPMPFYGSAAHVISMESMAPLATTCSTGNLPFFDVTGQTPLPLHIVLPRPAATITLKNLASASTDKLLVCFGLGQMMMEVDPGDETTPTGGGYSLPGVREIIVASASTAGAAVPFSIESVIGMEI